LGKGQIAADHAHGWQTVSASDIAFNIEDVAPHALTLDEIQSSLMILLRLQSVLLRQVFH
jgi:2,4-dienoyl-CoA reductase-like NADH-dependent reductase (Old Yellow Enzyme family)